MADPQRGRRWKAPEKRLFYLAYFVLLVCIFAYTLFPSERVAAYLSDRLRIAAPGCAVMIDGLKPAFPPGLYAAQLRLAYKNQEVLRIDGLKITPRWLQLVRMRPSVHFKGGAYGGRFDGRTEAGKDPPGRHPAVKVALSGIGIESVPRVRELTGHGIAGVMEGTLVIHAIGGVAESLTADLTVADAVIEPPAPVMTVDRLRFDRVAADIALDRRRLSIGQCRFQGPQVDGRIAGSIALMRSLGTSRLDLQGTVKPHTEFLAGLAGDVTASADFRKALGQNGFAFQFSGTFDRPKVALAPSASR